MSLDHGADGARGALAPVFAVVQLEHAGGAVVARRATREEVLLFFVEVLVDEGEPPDLAGCGAPGQAQADLGVSRHDPEVGEDVRVPADAASYGAKDIGRLAVPAPCRVVDAAGLSREVFFSRRTADGMTVLSQ